jgi:acyl-CoA thioesterase II
MQIKSQALRARARLGDRILAESTATLRVDQPDSSPTLWFPRSDVQPEVLDRDGQLWVAGSRELAECIRFDDAQIEVELIDDMGGTDARDVTVKRFPTWGDLTDLYAILDVQPDAPSRYLGPARDDARRPVVEGSQLLAQTLLAAARHVPGRRAVSASMVFARVATTREPVEIDLDEIANGRSFTVLAPRITQSGRTCAVGTLLLDATTTDLVRHHASAPDVPGPYDSTPLDLSLTGRDVRIVDNGYALSSAAAAGPPQLDAWVRFRETPDDQAVNVALLTHLTGFLSLAAALRPHEGIGLDQAHRTITTGVNAISLTIHDDVRVGDWMLYHHRSTFAGNGMTHSACRIHDEAGHLLASFTVDAMLRAMSGDNAAKHGRTVL